MSTLAKLEQVLPARLRPQMAAVSATEVVVRDGIPQVDPGQLAVLAACCRDLEIVAFGYSIRRAEASRRRVEPHRLVTLHGRWYLLAYDPDRADWLRPLRSARWARWLPRDRGERGRREAAAVAGRGGVTARADGLSLLRRDRLQPRPP
jgi:predicted DNA-binding transcriptional regulator YafY